MNLRNLSIFALLLHVIFSISNAGTAADAVRTLEINSYYFKPLSTIFGTINSSGWYHSASVDKDFSFYVGLPVSLTYINEKDRSYDSTYIDDQCKECIEQNRSSRGCIPSRTATLPTIFGRDIPPLLSVVSELNQNNDVTGFKEQSFAKGVDDLSRLNLMPFVALQLGVSWFYTALQFRFMTIPLDAFTITLPAFSLQHDLKSVFPKLPFHLSLADNATFTSVEWRPGDDVEGTVHFNGISNFLGVLAGYQFGVFEAFVQTGWEYSSMKASGQVTILPNEVINPSVKIIGRNAFRIGLNLALNVGYTATLGHSFGSEMNTTVNVIGYSYKKN